MMKTPIKLTCPLRSCKFCLLTSQFVNSRAEFTFTKAHQHQQSLQNKVRIHILKSSVLQTEMDNISARLTSLFYDTVLAGQILP